MISTHIMLSKLAEYKKNIFPFNIFFYLDNDTIYTPSATKTAV